MMKVLVPSVKEGSLRLEQVRSLADDVSKQTGSSGQSDISDVVKELESKWNICSSRLSTTKSDLQKQLDHWSQFETTSNDLSRWLKDIEMQTKDLESRSTLDEKKLQLHHLEVGFS